VIFDWSGTLLDDCELMWRANCSVLRHYGVEPLSFGDYREKCRFPVDDFYHGMGIKATHKELVRVFSEGMAGHEHVKLFPHAVELLRLLKHRRVHTALLTGNPVAKVHDQLGVYGLGDAFEEVRCEANDKSVDIHEVLAAFDVPRAETLFVGDMDHDIHAGKAAGVKTGAMTHGFHSREKLAAAKPDYFFDSLEEVEALFR